MSVVVGIELPGRLPEYRVRAALGSVARVGKSAAEAKPVGGGATENGEKPHHTAEYSSERSRLLSGEIQPLLQIESKRSKSPVVGKTLKNLADVGDPERTLEASSNFTQAFREQKRYLPWKLRASRALRPPTIPQPESLCCG